MDKVYGDLKNMLEYWFEESIEIEEIVAALHVFTIQCETTMRAKFIKDLQDDTV